MKKKNPTLFALCHFVKLHKWMSPKIMSTDLTFIHEKRKWGVEFGVGATALWIASMRKADYKLGVNSRLNDHFAQRFVPDNGIGEQIEKEIAESMANFFFTPDSNPNLVHPKLKKVFIFNNSLGQKYLKKWKDVTPTPKKLANSLALQRLAVINRSVHYDEEIRKAIVDEGELAKRARANHNNN